MKKFLILCAILLTTTLAYPCSASNVVAMNPGDYLQVVFNGAVRLDGQLSNAFQLSQGNKVVPVKAHFVGQASEGEVGAYKVFWLEPLEPLQEGVDYQLTIDKTITGKNGEKMSEPFTTAVRVNGKEAKPVVGDEGYHRSNPTPIGATLHASWSDCTADVKILEVIRGEEAWQKILEANRYNDPPTEGHEYILTRITFTYLGGPSDDKQYRISPLEFKSVSATGRVYDYASVVEPSPELSAALYPGASITGWAAYQVEKTDTKPLLTFGRNYDGTGGIWFKLYQ